MAEEACVFLKQHECFNRSETSARNYSLHGSFLEMVRPWEPLRVQMDPVMEVRSERDGDDLALLTCTPRSGSETLGFAVKSVFFSPMDPSGY